MKLPSNGMIRDRIGTRLISKREVWPVRSNRASEIGHHCIRYLYYMRTAWQEKPLPELGLLKIFEEGKVQERAVSDMLREIGLQVNQQQRGIDLKAYEIGGQIDGNSCPLIEEDWPDWPRTDDGKLMWVPTEIKTMSPWIWDSINTYEDLIHSDKHWLRKYPGQLQIYMLGIEQPLGLFILKNKTTYDIKDVWVPLDYDLANSLLDKATRINECMAKGEPPEGVETGYCRQCPFNVLCRPLITSGAGAEIFENAELEELLAVREQYAEDRKIFDQADRKVKATFKELPETFIVGDWFVDGKIIQRKAIPAKPESSYIKRTITRL